LYQKNEEKTLTLLLCCKPLAAPTLEVEKSWDTVPVINFVKQLFHS